ncbi:MAG: amidase [Chitinophagaceae bacterium]|nr:amidase [Chitinophagaceae bacterium]MBK7680341.1 amidase [Chitinophagaceae bacterium]MBK8301772.1 amidase [Chitinophagaceae bacterium]MBK9661161.1 amidase [Chitinophagaceae bacterium]MBK9938762.1 amidase [Chitinophagaceae bacterium]
MRLLLTALLCTTLLGVQSQTRDDSIQQIRNNAKWYDLEFTDAEADSMLGNLNNYLLLYKSMHKTLPANDIPFPFAFNPAPSGMKVSTKREKIYWDIPLRVELPANRNELAFYSIPQLASLILNKKISSVDLTKFFIDRLKKWGDTLECVITLTEDLAMKQAKQADEELKIGIYRGPLHGIPYGLKDLFAVKGYKTTWGSTPYKDQVLNMDSYVYKKLKDAGAVLCAKLSMGALANNNKWFGGETKNPWDLKQGSSGSSAGSASATAAGLLPFAIGTETLGSIVSPSTRCGATGLRPTFGTVSRYGAMVLCWSLDKVGPICRSAEDAAIVYAFIHGTDGNDPGAIRHTFNYSGKVDWSKIRIAYPENFFKRLNADAPEWKVIEIYRSLGATVQAINFPDSAMYPVNLVSIILNAESAAAFDELTRTNRDDLIERQDRNFWPNSFRAARTIPAVEYINANRYRSILCSRMNDFMKNYDVLIVPTFSGRQLSMTNLTGHPVVCMPIGFNQTGSPLSITLIGNLYDEATILAAAKGFQDKTEHNKKHPEKFKN